MADQFLGEIRIFGGNFAPVGWAFCNGQILSISQNTALFSLLGTQFGGNGTSNFALPNLQGSVPVDQGNGAGLTPRDMGETGGEQDVTLSQATMASHFHQMSGAATSASSVTPGPAMALAQPTAAAPVYQTSLPIGSPTTLNAGAVNPSGGSQPHNNLQPFLVLNFIIALQGIFPARP
jgi:microcystin-dependent protein